ncbi:MAG: SDR family NAD(P)-dependent oxidoreductase, partial [Pseudomonadota bacterium]
MSGSVIVLGANASNGVGGALARRFAGEGHHVFICGRTQENVEALADEITVAGGSAQGVRADVTSADDLDALFETVRERGELSGVLFNVGNNRS